MKRLLFTACIGLAVIGCKSKPERPVSEQDVYNSAKMRDLPMPVQASFNHEHPGAAVISSQIIHTATGPAAYQITYRAGEQTQQAWYREDGSPAEPARHR